jgi:hypothetical protein
MFRSRKARTLLMTVAFAVAWPSTSQAQQVLPLLDCVSYDATANMLTAYFGYSSTYSSAVQFDAARRTSFRRAYSFAISQPRSSPVSTGASSRHRSRFP